jgi:hypothetical protein
VGKVRLGIKKISPKTGKEYPTATDYLVFDTADEMIAEEIKKVYGDKPKSIDIMFLSDDENMYRKYVTAVNLLTS